MSGPPPIPWPSAEASPAPVAPRRWRLWIALVLAVIVVGAVLAYLALQPGLPLRILDLSVSPDPGVPGQPLTVTAHIQGGTFLRPVGVLGQFISFFADRAAGGIRIVPVGGDAFAGTIGPFPNGTTVWVALKVSDGTTRALGSAVVHVGPLPGGGPSGLAINTVTLEPPQPTSSDMPKVVVNVTSPATLTSVSLAYVGYGPLGGGGSGLTDMYPIASGDYYIPLFGTFGGPGSDMTVAGALWFYLIAAQDATGTTALSGPYNFTVASPG